MDPKSDSSVTVANAPTRPLLIWDGECGFCRLWVTRWRNEVAHAVDTAPYQEVEARFPEIPRAHFERAVQLVETNGDVTSGAEAVFRAFAEGGHPFALHLYKKSATLAAITNASYRFVATHRVLASKVTRAVWGRDPSPSTFRVARSLLVRGLGVVALAAFVSAWMQVDGLLGTSGISPVDQFLRSIGQMADDQGIALDRYRLVPTLLWLSPNDAGLHTLLAAGVLSSIALVLDWFASLAVVVAWASYLSIVTVGSVFFGYQWDTLLLEALFAAFFVVRWRVPRTKKARAASAAASASASAQQTPIDRVRGLIVPRLVFFKLMLLSGLVKLASNDAAWSSGRALAYHFWTQPLPTRLAWYAHQLPLPIRQASTFATLAIELVFPFFIFAPRPWRRVAFAGFALLQIVIALTGSYGFFNLLALVLSIPMLDDAAWRRAVPARWRGHFDQLFKVPDRAARTPPPARAPWRVRARVVLTAAALLLVVTPMAHMTRRPALAFWTPLTDYAEPLKSFNSYGLFAVMTTERPEITLEASMDGVTWEPYIFLYKPGPTGRMPRWTGLHMPRLDWQMWFAALDGDCRRERWYVAMMRRLFEGSGPVRDLFEHVPFNGAPPRFLRSTLSQYRFASPEEHAASGAIWTRESDSSFCPLVHSEGT